MKTMTFKYRPNNKKTSLADMEKAIAGKAELIEEIRQDRLENAGKPTPEYYITVGDIHEVIRKDDAIFIGKVVG